MLQREPDYINGGIVPQIKKTVFIPNKSIKEIRILCSVFKTLENKRDDVIIPTAKHNSTALSYIADRSKYSLVING